MLKRKKIETLGIIVVLISSGILGTFLFISVIQNATPSPRYGPAMVYDPVLQKTIFFGGGYQDTTGYEVFNDMWLYDSTSNLWTEIFPTVRPSARSGHKMVYDSINHKTILFGGWGDELGLMDDTWIYDSQTNQWTEVFPIDKPSIRQSISMYYDSNAQRIILFGGYRDVLPHFGDTWEYNYTDNSWTELNPSIHPSGRYGSNMIYDSNNDRGFLFGGRSSTIKDDTWVYYYGNNSWSEIIITIKPDTRYWHGMVYDPYNQKMAIFGGRHQGAPGEALDDTWNFDPLTNEWMEVLPTSHPSNRMDFSMIYDSNNQRTIVFGGFRFPGPTLGDTWTYTYNSNSWSQVKVANFKY
jgi:N-acetylneuraminic acid mutarotase